MTRYRYRAHDTEGRPYEDEVEAPSSFDLIQSLKSQGLTVTSAVPVRKLALPSAPFRNLRWEDLRLFCEQLEAILRSGYPLVPALAAMTAELRHPELRAATTRLQTDLESGRSLEEAFRMQESRFPPIFGAMMRAGEASGDLAGVLKLMTGHATRMAAVKHRIKMALVYPVILLVSTIWVVLHMLLNVVPVYAGIFTEMESALPASTRFLVWLSFAIRDHWALIAAAAPVIALCAVGLFIGLRRTRVGQRWMETVLLYCPGVGPAWHGVVQMRFCRTLALLLGGRVPLIDALTLAGAASGSAVLESGVRRAADTINEGGRLVDGLRRTRYFNPSFYWLLGTAEERDQVEDALENLGENAERNVQAREQMLGSFITPVLTFVLAIIIGFVVIALYLPIFALGDQIGGF